MYTEKHVLVKEMFTDRFNMCLLQRIWVEKTVHGVYIDSLVKKKVPRTEVSKGYVDSLQIHERPITFDFPEEITTVNSAS